MELQNDVENLANKTYGSQSFKEFLSYNGFSFWWLLKYNIFEKRVRSLNRLSLPYRLYAHYPFNLLKDSLAGSFPPKLEKSPLVIYSLLRLKPRYFNEIEEEFRKRKLPFTFLTYAPPLPNTRDLEEGKDCLFLESFIDHSLIREELNVRSIFAKKHTQLCNILRPYYKDNPNLPFLCKYFLEKEVPETYRLFRLAERALDKLKPKVILLTQEGGKHSYPVLAAAKKRNIKTVSLQHGALPVSSQDYRHLKQNISYNSNLLDFVLPDHFITYGNLDKKTVVKTAGFHANSVIPMGQPRYDGLFKKYKKLDHNALKQKYQLPADKKIVLWATQTHVPERFEDEHEKKVNMVFEAVSKLRNHWLLAIKLHQSEDQTAPLYSKYKSKYKGLAKIFDRTANTFELLLCSDIVLVTTSTVAIEALLVKKPILILDIKKSRLFPYLPPKGFKPVVQNAKELENYLRNITAPSSIKQFTKFNHWFRRECYSNFGDATKHICDFVQKFTR